MSLLYTHPIDGTAHVEVHSHGHLCPPDREMGAPGLSTWFRFVRGPSGWWMPKTKSQHKAIAALRECSDVIGVCVLCRGWQSEVQP